MSLAGWTARPRPGRAAMRGRFVTVEPIRDQGRFDELFDAYAADAADSTWAYLAYGPFRTREAFRAYAAAAYGGEDPLFHAVVPHAAGRAEGVASFLRIDPPNGVLEVGHIALAPSLRGTPATTEMQYLLMRRAFEELGYRRYEWKCDNDNMLSKRAALRLGFRHEGLFRQHMVVKGRNRDTAWFAVTDNEWPRLRAGFEAWLAPENFDANGQQRQRLEALR